MENKRENCNLFYCYSLNLMGWLIANGHRISTQETHSNGNHVWIFIRDEKLNISLTSWDRFKTAKEKKEGLNG